MPALWLLTLLAAAPRVELVERSTLGLSGPEGKQLRGQVQRALERGGLPTSLLTGACADHACLAARSRTGGACVVGVTLVKSRQGLTVDVEAVQGDETVAQRTWVTHRPSLDDDADVQQVVKALALRLAPPEAPPSDGPLATPRLRDPGAAHTGAPGADQPGAHAPPHAPGRT
jgi:hypothetical protein